MPGLSLSANESDIIQVIVNDQSELNELNRKQVMGLFLGRIRQFPNGITARPFDNEIGSSIRERFFEELTGKSISDIDAYWARLRYSGRASPPKVIEDLNKILIEVSINKHAIAYVKGQDPDKLAQKGIRVVHVIEGQ